MNILEAYLKKYNQLIILIVGLPCTNKSAIAKELSLDLSLPIIKINDYRLLDQKPSNILINKKKFKLYHSLDAFDWIQFNQQVNLHKSTGIIIYGNYLAVNKIDFNPDFTFYYNMNNTLCKKLLIEQKLLQIDDETKLDIFFNNIFLPLYEKLRLDLAIDKYFNIKENDNIESQTDLIFDVLMNFIQKKLSEN